MGKETICYPRRADFIYYARELPSNLKVIELYVISDSHYGDPFCSWKHVQRLLDYIAETKNAYIVLAGDLLDCRIKSSPGNIYEATANPNKQKKFILNKLKPLKHKILGITTGNHEDRILREAHLDISQELAEELECPYDPDGIFLKISFGSNNDRYKDRPYVYFTYHTHGWGSARTAGAQLMKVEREAEHIHASVITMSHDHTEMAMALNYLMPDPRTHEDPETGFQIGKVKSFKKMPVKVGAFLKYGGYGRKRGFKPRPLTTPVIRLYGEGKPNVTVTI